MLTLRRAVELRGRQLRQAVDLRAVALLHGRVVAAVVLEAALRLHRGVERVLKARVHGLAGVLDAVVGGGDLVALGLAAGVGVGDAVQLERAALGVLGDGGLDRVLQPFGRVLGVLQLLAHHAVGADDGLAAADGADLFKLGGGGPIHVVGQLFDQVAALLADDGLRLDVLRDHLLDDRVHLVVDAALHGRAAV